VRGVQKQQQKISRPSPFLASDLPTYPRGPPICLGGWRPLATCDDRDRSNKAGSDRDRDRVHVHAVCGVRPKKYKYQAHGISMAYMS
jgi:hypothetical protein